MDQGAEGRMKWDLEGFSNRELGHWLKELKSQPLRDEESEQVTSDLIGQIQDELATRHSNDDDAIHIQGQRR